MSRPTRETGWAYFYLRSNSQSRIASQAALGYFHAPIPRMKYLTKEQQTVLCVIILLLLTGLAVKTWRTAHPPKDRPVSAAPVQKP